VIFCVTYLLISGRQFKSAAIESPRGRVFGHGADGGLWSADPRAGYHAVDYDTLSYFWNDDYLRLPFPRRLFGLGCGLDSMAR